MMSNGSVGKGTGTDESSSHASVLGCLIGMARLRGVELTLDELLRGQHPAIKTMTANQLTRQALQAGLKLRFNHTAPSNLRHLQSKCPLIVQFVTGHSMIALRTETHKGVIRIYLQDPDADADADDIVVVDQYRFSDIWNGCTISVGVIENLGSGRVFEIKTIVRYIMSEKILLTSVVVSSLFLSLTALLPALMIQLLTYRVAEHRSVNTWAVVCGFVAAITGMETAFNYFRRRFTSRLVAIVDVRLTSLVFANMLNIPIDYFEKNALGLTVDRFNELSRVRNFLSKHVFGTMLDLSVLTFFIPVMLYIDWFLTLLILMVFATVVLSILILLPHYSARSGAVIRAEVNRSSFAMQTIAGIRTVKSLALEARQRHMWRQMTDRISLLRIAEGNMGNLMQTVTSFLERLMTTGALGAAVYLALTRASPLAVGSLYVFYILVLRVAAPLQQLAQLVNNYSEVRSAIREIGQLANQRAEEGRGKSGIVQPILGHVEFRGVRFKYKGSFRPALDDVSFDVPRGTTLGVMGRSGSGKTTLTRLLQRLHSDYRGQILVDGVDLRDYDIDHLRGSLGVVLQDNFLFSGTIRDNIKAAKADATFEEMAHAARLAGAEEFIDKLPRGYETTIYEGSTNLSGGQRQRLAIARALITDPKILILDEATSALDAESEAIVNENLREIAKDRTLIVISHRLSSLIAADAILVMEQGTVHDIGTHAELLGRCDIYSGLWHRQNQHAEIEGPGETLLLRGANVG